jgi:hypothetical protein
MSAAWVGTHRNLEKQIGPRYPVRRIEGTWLAVLDLRV